MPRSPRGSFPICSHLRTSEGRATDRLAAVLGDPAGRRAFERSYEVCIRHAPLLFERTAPSAAHAHLVEVVAARVAVDRWDAEEFLRKQSWSVRHEPRGSERTAWLRANARLAGALREADYGI